MLTLKQDDIFIGCRANSKRKALRIAADALQASGYVGEGFFASMVEREKCYQPAGRRRGHAPLCERRHRPVLQTGFQLFQFPDGVGWGEGRWLFWWSPWRQK